MAEKIYQTFNGASPTTAAQVAVTTGTAIKTLLQIAPPSTASLTIIEWGISFDAAALATPVKCELIETDVAATSLTAHVAAGIVKMNEAALAVASVVTLGTSATGYTAGAEGTTTASRVLDAQWVAPTNQYIKQFPLGREPTVQASKFLRVRTTVGVAVNALCYVVWSE
jgi:hypothetical protein